MAVVAGSGAQSTSFASAFDILKPQVTNYLFYTFGDEGLSAFNYFIAYGGAKEVKSYEFSHYEKARNRPIYITSGAADPGAGASITLPAALASQQTGTGLTTSVFPVVGNVMELANGTWGIVTSTTTTGITLAPLDTLTTFGAVAANAQIINWTSAYPEGSTGPTSQTVPWNKYDWQTQIIRKSANITGTDAASETWTPVTSVGTSGQSMQLGMAQAQYNNIVDISSAMQWQAPNNNTALDETFMTGLFPYAETNSPNITYTSGAFTKADFDDMTRTLDKRNVGYEYLGLMGMEQLRDIENGMLTIFANATQPFQSVTDEGSLWALPEGSTATDAKQVNINIRKVGVTGYNFKFAPLPQNSQENMGGAVGFNKASLGVYLAQGNTTDAKTQESMKRFNLRYQSFNGENRWMKTVTTGMNAGTDTYDGTIWNTLSQCGTQIFGRETMLYVQPS